MSNITLIKKTKIMSDHGHALILSQKKEWDIYWLMRWHKDLRSFPFKSCKFEKIVKKKNDSC